ncbi:tetratricopeptide repeat protein [Flavobacterium sp. 14A]|uniref:tetratricopeptide repeat protein n=1 Tax=Flavobacterium sp. 14A TaxID=2735896 RepID=UPI00156DF3C1|nr:tetratricopeptide repeat protein [Flavobacterium sp. 14A]NRT11424.1 tetratricopeptide (TPR) repeat protein [Flavobacterium sp. 14A]
MKKIILTLLFLSNLSYSQNRYSQSSTSTYTPMTLSEMMVVPQNLSNKYNENQKYLYSLKNWILELKPQVTEQSFIIRFNKEYNDLVKIEDKDLSKATQYLQQTENAIREIISDYNIYVAKLNKENQTKQNQTSTNNSSQNLIQVAFKYYEEKDFAKSVATFSKYLENDKNNTDVIFYRALAKTELNDFYGAISDYEKIIELNSNYPLQYNKYATVYNNKAYTLVRLKKFQEALPFVEKALALDKTEWFIWDTRGEIYYNLAIYDKSLKDLNKAIELKENDNSYFLRGLVYIKLGQKEKGCKDLSKSGELGNSEAYEKIKINCK